jgi:hypothetical protein
MLKLYHSQLHPGQWIAHSPETGWVIFPAKENGWEARRPGRGLDPLHLRQAPLQMAQNTGVNLPLMPLKAA